MSDYCNPLTSEDVLNSEIEYPVPDNKTGGATTVADLQDKYVKEHKVGSRLNEAEIVADKAANSLSRVITNTKKISNSLQENLRIRKASSSIAMNNMSLKKNRSII
jgi:hypothetical protein